MRPFTLVLSCVLVLVAYFFILVPKSFSDELDDINREIEKLTQALSQSKAATAPLESQLVSMQKQIEGIKQRVALLEIDVAQKRKNIQRSYANLARQEEIMGKTIRDFYIKSYYSSPLLIFLSAQSASDLTQALAYKKATTDRDKVIITNLALSILDLEEKKLALEQEQTRLSQTKQSLDTQSAELDNIIQGAKSYQATLSNQIAQLSTKQQQILSARSGTFTVSIGDSELADDYNASIKGFRESAPSGSFAVFSFGAHTHRKGMSQYGARGRAEKGQSYNEILKKYYGKDVVSKDTGGSIKVSGYGDLDFETTYLFGIAEMPSSWHKEALKAQAVAARTYALRFKQDGKEICTTQACQVFSKSKSDNVPAEWKSAVEETKGQVLEDVVTYYSSTTGGWLSTSGWDTTDGGGGGSFVDKTYEKLGGSPWVYKAWYTKDYSPNSDKCGRSNPWLNQSDIADILNAMFVLFGSGSGADTGRVTPPTTSCWGGNPYSQDELRSVSENYGGGISSVSSVSVLQGDGTTNEAVFQTDKGERRVNGGNFKTAFNLRAPGYLSIPQSGFAFYNIEKK